MSQTTYPTVNGLIPNFPALAPGDERYWAIDFADVLSAGQALTGSPTVAILDQMLAVNAGGGTVGSVVIQGTQVVFQITAGGTYGLYYARATVAISGGTFAEQLSRSGSFLIQFK